MTLIAAASSGLLPAQPPDDTPIEELVAHLALENDRGAEAQLELLRRGAEAAPALGACLRHGPPGVRVENRARAAAARVLIELGPEGVGAFDSVAECLRASDVPVDAVVDACEVLFHIGPFAGERAATLLGRRNAGMRLEAASRWLRFGSALEVDAAGGDCDTLLESLDADNPYVVVTACRALGARSREFATARGRIVSRLRAVVDRELRGMLLVRGAGMRGMWNADEANVRWLRTHASLALCAYAPDDEYATLGHAQRLFALDPDTRIAAARDLGRLRREAAGRWLLESARLGPPEVALEMLRAIERIGPTLAGLAPELFALEWNEGPEIAAAARRVRRAIAPDFEPGEADSQRR